MVCFLICHDNIMTNGLSNCDHMKGCSFVAQIISVYMREGLTNELKSYPLIVSLGSVHGGIVSIRVRGTHVLVLVYQGKSQKDSAIRDNLVLHQWC